MTDAEKIRVLREALRVAKPYVDRGVRHTIDSPSSSSEHRRDAYEDSHIVDDALSTTEPAPRDSSAPGETAPWLQQQLDRAIVETDTWPQPAAGEGGAK